MTRLENRVVSRLPSPDREKLVSLCETCSLVVSQVLSEVDQPSEDLYFPLDAVVSVVALTSEREMIGLGLIGREGMLGSELALGIATHSLRMVVQGAGSALRINIASFQEQFLADTAMYGYLSACSDGLMRQVARSAACAHFHEIGPRLARWLLMSQDRCRSHSFHITHDFLAHMLGVRRVGITAAAFELQRNGMIQYHRGDMVVLDRVGLKASACSCYVSDLRAWSA